MKQVAGSVKLELAQYRELETFAQTGSDLDEATKAQLERGRRLTELMKQAQSSPVPVEEQAIILFSAVKGHLDIVPVKSIVKFEDEFLKIMRASHADILATIRKEKMLSPDTEKKLAHIISDFAKLFVAQLGS